MGRLAAMMLIALTDAIDNGLGVTPPMGWRHWKAFYAHIDQKIMEQMQDEMVKKRPVDGELMSLKDLGYRWVASPEPPSSQFLDV